MKKIEETPKEIGPAIRLIRDKNGNVIECSTENVTSSLFVTTK